MSISVGVACNYSTWIGLKCRNTMDSIGQCLHTKRFFDQQKPGVESKKRCTVYTRELTYPPDKAYLKMIFLFPKWDMLVSWRVIVKRIVPFETEKSFPKEGTKKHEFFMSKKHGNSSQTSNPLAICAAPIHRPVLTRKLRDQCLGNKDHATDCSQWLPALREAWYPRDHREPNIRSRNKPCTTG